MAIEIKAPVFPESVSDGEVATWHKSEGDSVSRDELIVEIETDKVVLEVVSPQDGVIKAIHVQQGDIVQSQQLLATIEAGAVEEPEMSGSASGKNSAAVASGGAEPESAVTASAQLGPAARQLVDEHNLVVSEISGTGKSGRITKEDVVAYMSGKEAAPEAPEEQTLATEPVGHSSERVEKRVPMTRMRAKIAERLLDATQQTAMLSTFNEVNMAPVMALRSK